MTLYRNEVGRYIFFLFYMYALSLMKLYIPYTLFFKNILYYVTTRDEYRKVIGNSEFRRKLYFF